MTIKRICDPAELLPDLIHIEFDGKHSVKEELEALAEVFAFSSLSERIDRLRRHTELCEKADELSKQFLALSDKPNEDKALLVKIGGAERRALYLDVAPKVIRDNARQNGTHKERRPEITKWLNVQLDRDSGAKSPHLWENAPEWLTDQIRYDAFAKRVTSARKKRRK